MQLRELETFREHALHRHSVHADALRVPRRLHGDQPAGHRDEASRPRNARAVGRLGLLVGLREWPEIAKPQPELHARGLRGQLRWPHQPNPNRGLRRSRTPALHLRVVPGNEHRVRRRALQAARDEDELSLRWITKPGAGRHRDQAPNAGVLVSMVLWAMVTLVSVFERAEDQDRKLHKKLSRRHVWRQLLRGLIKNKHRKRGLCHARFVRLLVHEPLRYTRKVATGV